MGVDSRDEKSSELPLLLNPVFMRFVSDFDGRIVLNCSRPFEFELMKGLLF